MPHGQPYNVNLHNQHDPQNPNYLGDLPTGQINLLQSLQPSSFMSRDFIVQSRFVKGCLAVEYLSQLLQDSAYGVFKELREEGMLVYVRFSDDGTPLKKHYKLVSGLGLGNLTQWQLLDDTKGQIDWDSVTPLPDLATRDAIALVDRNGLYVIADARTSVEIDEGEPIYSNTFGWNSDNNEWVAIKVPYNVSPEVILNSAVRHSKNEDTHLDQNGVYSVSAQSIVAHLKNDDLHFGLSNDNSNTSNKVALSAFVIHELFTVFGDSTYSKNEVDALLLAIQSSNSIVNADSVTAGKVEIATKEDINNGSSYGQSGAPLVVPISLVQKNSVTYYQNVENGIEINVNRERIVQLNSIGNITSIHFTGGDFGQEFYLRIKPNVDETTLKLADDFKESYPYNAGHRVQYVFDNDSRKIAVYEAKVASSDSSFDPTKWKLIMVVNDGIKPFIHLSKNKTTTYLITGMPSEEDTSSIVWQMELKPSYIV